MRDDQRITRPAPPVDRPNDLARKASSRYGEEAVPFAVAHRGGAGLEPENTLAAFARSYALGLRYLETDVRVTTDGVCVSFHDADTRRLTGARGPVGERSWAQLQHLRVRGQHRVPRLEEVLDLFPDARLTLDLKDPRAIGPLAAVLRRSNAWDRVCVAGSADSWLADVRAVCGGRVATALGWQSLVRLVGAARLGVRPRGVVRAPFAHVPLRLGGVPIATPRLIDLAHELGSQVLVWTVDSPAVMHGLLDRGADGIISNRPDLLREVLIARGQWHPPACDARPTPRPEHRAPVGRTADGEVMEVLSEVQTGAVTPA